MFELFHTSYTSLQVNTGEGGVSQVLLSALSTNIFADTFPPPASQN